MKERPRGKQDISSLIVYDPNESTPTIINAARVVMDALSFPV
ncbi:MAG TPA: hypothetical protein VGL94_17710 [Ktedonobacteraceae bacterium]